MPPRGRVRRATFKPNASVQWEVEWHPAAREERRSIEASERRAIHHVIEKLRATGVRLPSEHQRAIRGPGGEGLWELRPRCGKSRWRPLYRQCGERTFIVLAIAPEVEVDKRGYQQAIKLAQQRWREREQGGASRQNGGRRTGWHAKR